MRKQARAWGARATRTDKARVAELNDEVSHLKGLVLRLRAELKALRPAEPEPEGPDPRQVDLFDREAEKD